MQKLSRSIPTGERRILTISGNFDSNRHGSVPMVAWCSQASWANLRAPVISSSSARSVSRGNNIQLPLSNLLRQSVYIRLAGCGRANDAERLPRYSLLADPSWNFWLMWLYWAPASGGVAAEEPLLERMADTITHGDPDDDGYRSDVDRRFSLGFRCLTISHQISVSL